MTPHVGGNGRTHEIDHCNCRCWIIDSVSIWATMVTAGDDDCNNCFPPFKTTRSSSFSNKNVRNGRIVILCIGWGGLSLVLLVHDNIFHILRHWQDLLLEQLFSEVHVNPFVIWYQMLLPKSKSGSSSSTTYVRADARCTDISNKRVHWTTGSRDSTSPELEWSFDKLVLIATSAQPNSFGIPDVKEYVIFMKEVEESSKLQSRLYRI